MRYKKLLVIITCSIFITALITCFFSVFKLAEINVYTTSVENSNENVKELVDNYAKKYHEDNLFFVSEDKIKKDLNGLSGYINVKSVKKEYPNKLIISVVERKEVFALYINGVYYMLDENLVILSTKQENKNNIDSNNNVLLNINVADYDNNSIKIGKTLKLYDKNTLSYFKEVSNLIFENRNNLKSVEIKVKESSVFNRCLTLKFKEGLTLTINDASVQTVRKFNESVNYYLGCEDKGDSKNYFVDISSNDEIVIY